MFACVFKPDQTVASQPSRCIIFCSVSLDGCLCACTDGPFAVHSRPCVYLHPLLSQRSACASASLAVGHRDRDSRRAGGPPVCCVAVASGSRAAATANHAMQLRLGAQAVPGPFARHHDRLGDGLRVIDYSVCGERQTWLRYRQLAPIRRPILCSVVMGSQVNLRSRNEGVEARLLATATVVAVTTVQCGSGCCLVLDTVTSCAGHVCIRDLMQPLARGRRSRGAPCGCLRESRSPPQIDKTLMQSATGRGSVESGTPYPEANLKFVR